MIPMIPGLGDSDDEETRRAMERLREAEENPALRDPRALYPCPGNGISRLRDLPEVPRATPPRWLCAFLRALGWMR